MESNMALPSAEQNAEVIRLGLLWHRKTHFTSYSVETEGHPSPSLGLPPRLGGGAM